MKNTQTMKCNNRYEKAKNLLIKNGNQIDIFGNKMYDLLPIMESYSDFDYHEFERSIEMLTATQLIDLKNVISYLDGKTSIEILEYKLYNVTPTDKSKLKERPANTLTKILAKRERNKYGNEMVLEHYDKDLREIAIYNSIDEAALKTGLTPETITSIIESKTAISFSHIFVLKPKKK